MTQAIATELGLLMNQEKVLHIMNKYGLQTTYIKKLQINYSKLCHLKQRGRMIDIIYWIFSVTGKRTYL